MGSNAVYISFFRGFVADRRSVLTGVFGVWLCWISSDVDGAVLFEKLYGLSCFW